MVREGTRQYSWYKHHAWAALALLSLFFAVTRFVTVPPGVSLLVVGVLGTYALVAIALTYRHNEDNIACEQSIQHESSPQRELDAKDLEKVEKKRLKAQAKLQKKQQA